jgi:hypothetical protein
MLGLKSGFSAASVVEVILTTAGLNSSTRSAKLSGAPLASTLKTRRKRITKVARL